MSPIGQSDSNMSVRARFGALLQAEPKVSESRFRSPTVQVLTNLSFLGALAHAGCVETNRFRFASFPTVSQMVHVRRRTRGSLQTFILRY